MAGRRVQGRRAAEAGNGLREVRRSSALVPRLIGLARADARRLLGFRGLRTRAGRTGSKRELTRGADQRPAPGRNVRRGATARLFLAG
jgi:hypothetical protein